MCNCDIYLMNEKKEIDLLKESFLELTWYSSLSKQLKGCNKTSLYSWYNPNCSFWFLCRIMVSLGRVQIYMVFKTPCCVNLKAVLQNKLNNSLIICASPAAAILRGLVRPYLVTGSLIKQIYGRRSDRIAIPNLLPHSVKKHVPDDKEMNFLLFIINTVNQASNCAWCGSMWHNFSTFFKICDPLLLLM